MSDQQSEQSLHCSRRRKREKEGEMSIIILVVGFIIVVVSTWFNQRYRTKQITHDEDLRAQKRAMWMDTLMDDTTCLEMLRLDRRRFEKLYVILQSNGGLVTTRMSRCGKLWHSSFIVLHMT